MNKYFLSIECKCGCNEDVVFGTQTLSDGTSTIGAAVGVSSDMYSTLEEASQAARKFKEGAIKEGLENGYGKITIMKASEVAVFTPDWTPPDYE